MTRPCGSRDPWQASPRKVNSWPTSMRASGCRWIRCATNTSLRSYGCPGARRGKCGADGVGCAPVNAGFWRGRRVLITGHTGFKGGWLALWLDSLGARVHGFSLAPPTEPNFFTAAQVREGLAGHTIGDIRDLGQLTQAMQAAAPQIVLHLSP